MSPTNKKETPESLGWKLMDQARKAVADIPLALDLIARGADVHTKPQSGDSILIWAAHNGHTQIVEAILDRYPHYDIDETDSTTGSRQTLLHEAVDCNSLPLARLLLRRGADIDKQNAGGRTPLAEATCCGLVEMTELLLNKGARRDIPDKDGLTPEQHAEAKKIPHIIALYNSTPAMRRQRTAALTSESVAATQRAQVKRRPGL